jgi:FAD:protein FMN transferase
MTLPTFRHEAMTTYFEIIIAGHPEDYARQAAGAAFRLIDQLEGELSRFRESSDIARASRLGFEASAKLGEAALECLLVAADVSLATRRAFDPAYASLRPPELPADSLPFTLDPATHSITSRTTRLQLDLGAIGKGYALDCAAETLREWEIESACLSSGGSTVLALGPPPGGRGWNVGLGEGHGYRAGALLKCSLSGSGTAVKGAHLVDPRTNRPVAPRNRVWSLAPSAAQADALSTAFFVMNEAEIAAFCGEHPSIGAALAGPGAELSVHGALRQFVIDVP